MCSKVLAEGDKIKAFPAFLPHDHKFGKFSDAAFHGMCFEADPSAHDVDDMFYVWEKIQNSRPKDLKSVEEIEEWSRKAFEDWPPKNGVVIYEQCWTEDGEEPEWFWADKDMWEEFERVEREQEEKMEKLREESRREEREAWRYARDD